MVKSLAIKQIYSIKIYVCHLSVYEHLKMKIVFFFKVFHKILIL